jgi:TolB protein
MNERNLVLTFLVIISILFSVFLREANAQEHPKAEIAFISARDGELNIYVMDVDGNILRNLTKHHRGYEDIAWSHDGQKIAFTACEDRNGVGETDIFVMKADGSGEINLTNGSGVSQNPTWSPDGKKIAFHYCKFIEDIGIYSMDADGKHLQRLTSNINDCGPFWSSDGQTIIFSSDRDEKGNMDIYVMNPDGENIRRLTDNPAQDSSPELSPDGSRIAFVSYRDNNRPGIFIMNADGTNVHKLSDEYLWRHFNPSWSPDSRYIAFVSKRDDDWEIYTIGADGGGLRRLTDHPGLDFSPVWNPLIPYAISPIGTKTSKWGEIKQAINK